MFRLAISGEVALKSIKAKQPSLILLDIRMPVLSGFEVCKILKSDETTTNIPIILISASDRLEDKIEGFKLGAVDYIAKPFFNEEVIARVKIQVKFLNAKSELSKQYNTLNSINESISTTIFSLNTNYNYTSFNKAHAKSNGKPLWSNN